MTLVPLWCFPLFNLIVGWSVNLRWDLLETKQWVNWKREWDWHDWNHQALESGVLDSWEQRDSRPNLCFIERSSMQVYNDLRFFIEPNTTLLDSHHFRRWFVDVDLWTLLIAASYFLSLCSTLLFLTSKALETLVCLLEPIPFLMLLEVLVDGNKDKIVNALSNLALHHLIGLIEIIQKLEL